jgi:hypothetical protein
MPEVEAGVRSGSMARTPASMAGAGAALHPIFHIVMMMQCFIIKAHFNLTICFKANLYLNDK